MLTIAQTSMRLSLDRSTVMRLIYAGKLRAYRHSTGGVRGTYRIDEADLAAYLETARNAAQYRGVVDATPEQLAAAGLR